MNDVIRTIKSNDAKMGVCGNCGPVRDLLHVCDVKPDTEPDWATALVVRVGADEYWARAGSKWQFAFKSGEGTLIRDAEQLDEYFGPLTVVIDADGRNVEAQEMSEQDDRRYAELSDQAYRCHLAWKSARQRARRSHLEAEKLRAEAVEFADEWEPLRNQLNEAVRAREIAQRDLRIAQRTISRLGDENARLQAQTGDGR